MASVPLRQALTDRQARQSVLLHLDSRALLQHCNAHGIPERTLARLRATRTRGRHLLEMFRCGPHTLQVTLSLSADDARLLYRFVLFLVMLLDGGRRPSLCASCFLPTRTPGGHCTPCRMVRTMTTGSCCLRLCHLGAMVRSSLGACTY